MNWIELNNQVIVRDKDGKYQLDKDKEALEAYLEYSVKVRMKEFSTIKEKIDYLVKNNYYSEKVIKQYSTIYIEKLYEFIKSQDFKFESYMSASKFFENYALKSNDGKSILESYEDKILIVSLALANGDENFAKKIADKLIKQEFQPATPTFLNAGRARAGERVSSFLISDEESCEGISYAVD